MRQEERYDSIRVCEHESDYSVLYDFVGMRHAMCKRLLARGRARAYGQGHGKHIQEMAAACGERGVPSLQRRRHVTEGLHKMLSCFVERDCNDAENR